MDYEINYSCKLSYNGLSNAIRIIVDVIIGGSLMGKNIENPYELLEEMAIDACQWPSKCNTSKKALRVYKLDRLKILSSQVITLKK